MTLQIDCNGASVSEDLLLAFKAIVAKEKVSEIVHFEAMQESCVWLTWRSNGRKLGQTRSSEQMGASNEEQTCSHVNKGFNCKHLQKKWVFLMCHFLQVPFPNASGKGMDPATVSHTSSGKARVQKKDFRQGAKLK